MAESINQQCMTMSTLVLYLDMVTRILDGRFDGGLFREKQSLFIV